MVGRRVRTAYSWAATGLQLPTTTTRLPLQAASAWPPILPAHCSPPTTAHYTLPTIDPRRLAAESWLLAADRLGLAADYGRLPPRHLLLARRPLFLAATHWYPPTTRRPPLTDDHLSTTLGCARHMAHY